MPVRKEVAPPLAAAQLHVTVSDHAASHPDGPCHRGQGDAGDYAAAGISSTSRSMSASLNLGVFAYPPVEVYFTFHRI